MKTSTPTASQKSGPAQVTAPAALSAECQVMCGMFSRLPEDKKISVLTDILNLIQDAKPSTKVDVPYLRLVQGGRPA